MPIMKDPTAPRKKYLLVNAIREWNDKHPDKHVSYAAGFDPATEVVGTPARETLKAYERMVGWDVSGQFNKTVMRQLILIRNPVAGIRSEVMGRAHAELGVHEWPSGSNMGPIVKYLQACGIGPGNPWCAAFVTWCLKNEGFKKFPTNPAWCPSWAEWAKKNKLTKPMKDSQAGDLWLWDWNGGAEDHIGFCDEGVKGYTAYYLDGNVGAYGGSVTDAARPASGIALVIDLVKLSKL